MIYILFGPVLFFSFFLSLHLLCILIHPWMVLYLSSMVLYSAHLFGPLSLLLMVGVT